MSTMGQPRVGENIFRENSPQAIDGIEIVSLARFDGGSRAGHRYAAAAALNRRGDTWCTHVLIYNYDTRTWFLHQGHYDFQNRTAAEADMNSRSLG